MPNFCKILTLFSMMGWSYTSNANLYGTREVESKKWASTSTGHLAVCVSPWGRVYGFRETYSIGKCETCTCRGDGAFWCEDFCASDDTSSSNVPSW